MKKLRIYFILCLFYVGLSSCEGFLDKYPTDAIPEEEAYQTFDDFKRHCVSAYSSLKSNGGFTYASRIFGDLQCDLAYSVQGFSNTVGPLYNWTFNSTSSEVNSIYSSMWMSIGRINRIMDHLPEIYSNVSQKDSARVESLCGDLYFMRALCYSELVKYYCDAYDPVLAETQLGLPLCESTNVKDVPRSSLKATYDFIFKDLERAEERVTLHLTQEDTYYGGNTFVSLEAILALRARMALYQCDYSYANAQAKKAITSCNNGGLGIATAETVQGDVTAQMVFNTMFMYDANPEVIFMVGMTPLDVVGSMGSRFLGTTFEYRNFYPDYVPSKFLLDLYTTTDIRREAYFERHTTAYPHKLSWELLVKDSHNPELDRDPKNPAFQSQPKLLRMAELYLIVAEANAMPGMNLGEGVQYLKEFKSFRIPNFSDNSSYTAEQLLREVQLERAREFCFEGFRLADLKRWKMGFRREPQPFTSFPSNSLVINPGDVRFTWPIPKHELEVNPNMKPNASN